MRRRLTAGAGSGVMESFQQGRAGTDSIAAGEDVWTGFHVAALVALITTIRIFRGTIGFCHFENLPRLRSGVAIEKELMLDGFPVEAKLLMVG